MGLGKKRTARSKTASPLIGEKGGDRGKGQGKAVSARCVNGGRENPDGKDLH